MKWLIVVVIVLIIVAALWLRSVRGIRASSPSRAHRLDDSLSVSEAPIPRAEPSPHVQLPPPRVSEEAPGSDFAQEPEITDDEDPPSSTATPTPSA